MDKTATNSNSPGRKLRWYQFRLRSLLLAFVVVALGCGWFIHQRKQAIRQEQAVATLNADVYCAATYSYTLDEQSFDPREASYWPKPLRNLLGDDFFFPVRQVYVRETPIPEYVWHVLGELPDVWVVDGPLGDRELKRIAATFPRLRALEIRWGHVTDVGLEHVAGMSNLEYLSLPFPYPGVGEPITDEDLRHLTRLKKLRVLKIPRANVSSEGLAHLAEIASLEKLVLRGTSIGDAELRVLARLPRLASLDICSTAVTDQGLHVLKDFPSLRRLHLIAPNITPDGLAELTALPRLEMLELDGELFLSGETIVHLQRCPALRELHLMDASNECIDKLAELRQLEVIVLVGIPMLGPCVDDQADFRKLTCLPRLRKLDLLCTIITDKTLPQLAALPALEELRLPRTCTQAGIKRLRKQRPGLLVSGGAPVRSTFGPNRGP